MLPNKFAVNGVMRGGEHEELEDIPADQDELNEENPQNERDENEEEGRTNEFEGPADNLEIIGPGEGEETTTGGTATGGVSKEIKQKMTTRYMTKYERARILGTRALQISMNAPIMVELEGETDPLQIAMKELRERKIPLMIRRYLPDESYEDWSIEELEIEL